MWRSTLFAAVVLFCSMAAAAEPMKVGIIGLDTSHAPAFAKFLNGSPADANAACRVVAAYPQGSKDIPSSVERVPQYTEQLQGMGVEIVGSIEALLEKVDAVLLETNDGRPHFEQALPVLKAGKPCFIDKPVAGSLSDAIAIFMAAEKHSAPVFTSSSLRYLDGVQQARSGEFGKVLGCDAYSPCSLEATHPDLYWYGIHGVEILYTAMGTGCEEVSRVSTADAEFVVGKWNDGRIGTFRGTRSGPHLYGATVFTAKGVKSIAEAHSYQPLIQVAATFFHSGKPPVSAEESLEIYTFMEAADESKRQGGKPVKMADVYAKAKAEAVRKLGALGD